MASFNWPAEGGSGGGINKYATAANLPITASNGDVAVVVDTGFLYEYTAGNWVIVGGPDVYTTVSDTSTIDLTLTGPDLTADIVAGSIDNALISATAAIDYSKLSLSSSIVDADVSNSAAIAYSKLNLSNSVNLASDITGVLPIANGGTSVSSVPTNGQLLIGNGTNYTVATITGTSNQITVTNGVGSITLSLPQSIATTSDVTFDDITGTTSLNSQLLKSTSSGGLEIRSNSNTLIATLGAGGGAQAVFEGALETNTSLIIQDPGAGTNAVTIQSPTLASSYTLTLPTDDGNSGQFLQTNGSGVLSWQSPFVSSANDTNSIDLTVSSGALSADLKISVAVADAGNINAINSIETDGLQTQVAILVGDSGSGGAAGVVPAPTSGDAASNKFLKADATWSVIPFVDAISNNTFTGTTITANSSIIQKWRYTGGSAQSLAAFDFSAIPDGGRIIITGSSDTNTLEFPVGLTNVTINGSRILYQYSTIELVKDNTQLIEVSRNGI